MSGKNALSFQIFLNFFLDHEMAPERSQIPDQPVEITLEMPDILKRKIR